MVISWQLIIIIVLALVFLYLLYNALKISLAFYQARKNLKKRQKTSQAINRLQDDLDQLTKDLRSGPK